MKSAFRRTFSPACLSSFSLLCALALPAAAAPAANSTDYNTQKTQLKASRYSSISELQALGRNAVGRVVELGGEVRGVINRGTGVAILFRMPEGQLLMLDTPEFLRSSQALNLGSTPRILAKIDGIMGNEVALSLLNATDDLEYEPAPRIPIDPDAPVILTPNSGPLTPLPSTVFNNPAGKIRKPAQTAPTLSIGPGPDPLQTGPTLLPDTTIDASQRQSFKALARRFNPRLDDTMADYISTSLLSAANRQNLDPRFLAAVVSVESSFNPYCVSPSGALGLGQIMPFNLRGLGISNAYDPAQNLHGSARMLRNNLDRFAGQDNPTLLAVAAYHAGGNAVSRAGNQVPNKAATQRYVWKVYYAYKSLAPELFN